MPELLLRSLRTFKHWTTGPWGKKGLPLSYRLTGRFLCFALMLSSSRRKTGDSFIFEI